MSGVQMLPGLVRCAVLVAVLAACSPAVLPSIPTATSLSPEQPPIPTVLGPATSTPSRAVTVTALAPGVPTATLAAPTSAPVRTVPAAAALASPTPRPSPLEDPTRAVPATAEPARSAPSATPVPKPSPAPVACVAPREASALVGRPGCVEGTVTRVTYAASSRGSPTFVDFGEPFTALVWIEDRPQFPDVDAWQGQRLRVRGAVELYRGRPEIVLRSADQVTVLGR